MENSYSINEKNYYISIVDNEKNAKNKKSSNILLPFLKVNIEKINDLNRIPNKMEKSNLLINYQTDKLLETGFQGDEEDFKNCYKKIEPEKVNQESIIKQKKLNKLLVKDDYLGPIKLTKIREFNITKREKNKLIDKLNQLKEMKINNQYNKYFQNFQLKRNSIISNNKIDNNSTTRFNNSNSLNNISSTINGNGNNIFFNNSSLNMDLFDNSTTNNYNLNRNSLKGAYFIYKNNSQDMNIKSKKNLSNHSMSINEFITLRDILTNTTHNLNNINDKLKRYINKNNSTKNFNSITHKEKGHKNMHKNRTFYDDKKKNYEMIHEVLDSLRKKDKDQILKQIKKERGTSIQNIWLKKSTANLVSFGKSFQTLTDDLFYKEHKRIISKYPEIQKDADLPVPDKKEDDSIKKIHRIKLERNSRLIKDLNYNNKQLVNQLKKRMKKQKQ